MKNDKEKQKDIDATAAWLMKQYTLAVQEVLQSETDDEEMPEELDKKCRELIKKEVKRQRYKQIAKKAGRFTCAAMLTVVMLFGVVGILFTTVEAVRAPIIRFFIAQKEGHLEITDSGEESDTRTLTNTADFSEMNARLAALLPEGYVQTDENVSSMGNTMATYVNLAGDSIVFRISLQQKTFLFDTEEANSVKRMKIGKYDAILVEKNGYRLAWFDAENNVLYQLVSDALSQEEIVNIANNLL